MKTKPRKPSKNLDPVSLVEDNLQRVLLMFASLSGVDPDDFFDQLRIKRDRKIVLTKKEREIPQTIKARLDSYAKNVDALAGLPEDQKNAQTPILFNSMLRDLLPMIPPEANPADWFLSHLTLGHEQRSYRNPEVLRRFSATGYDGYLKSLEELVSETFKMCKAQAVNQFVKGIQGEDRNFRDVFPFIWPVSSQEAITTSLREAIKYVTLKKPSLRQLKSVYSDLAPKCEIMLRMILQINDIVMDRPIDNLDALSLGTIIEKLQEFPKMRALTAAWAAPPINDPRGLAHMRNALAHSHVNSQHDGSIEFVDRDVRQHREWRRVINYKVFHRLTLELAVLSYALLLWNSIFNSTKLSVIQTSSMQSSQKEQAKRNHESDSVHAGMLDDSTTATLALFDQEFRFFQESS